jgi:acyl-CoA synthetase (AMP-forming)/AMP-acid ligase II
MLMYTWYVRGAKQVILPAFDFSPDILLRTVEEHRVTTMFMIPTVLNVLLDSDALERYDTSSLRSIVYGGAPIPLQRIREALEAFGPVLVQIYGSSEAPNVLTTLSPEEHEFEGEPPKRLRSAGRVALGVEVKVVDGDGAECAPGEVGEVVSRGPHTMVGYWRDPDLTAERVRDGWVHTRDVGSFDEDGYLHIVDRKDDMIISGGFNVWPAEVEEAIYRHPAVREAAAFGVADAKWGETIVAAVSLKRQGAVDEDGLRAFLREHVSRHKVPKRIWFREADIPKSPVGKPLRRAVADEYVRAKPHG